MEKKFFQTSIKDSLFTGLIALALFGPIVGLRTVAKNEVLEVHPKWFIVLIIVIVCAVGRFLTNLYVYNRDQKTGIQSSIGKSISNFLDTKGYQIALTAIIFSVIFPFLPFTDRYLMDIAIMMLTYIMLGWGLNIVIGLAGLLDLGYVAFYAVGAYSYALFAIHFGWSFWICLPIAGIFAAMFGVLLGFPVLRLRGDYLAIVTLAFGEMIRILLLNWYQLTKGPDGLTGIPRPSFFGLPFKSFPDEGEQTFHTFFGIEYDPMQRIIFLYYLILVLALITNLFTIKIRRLPIGAMFGGFAGSFFATRQAFISPESFTFIESAIIVAIVVLGGMGSQTGVVLATVFLIGLIEVFRDFESYRMIAFGGAMVLIMIFRPRGILATRKPTITLEKSSSK